MHTVRTVLTGQSRAPATQILLLRVVDPTCTSIAGVSMSAGVSIYQLDWLNFSFA